MDRVKIEQTCYSYSARELALKLGLTLTPQEWVVVEVDESTVDVFVRKRVEP